jgi:steroid Delta-isomerase
MPDRDAIVKTISTYAAAWAARDREGWLDTFAELATQEDPVGEGTRRGRDEIGEFWDRAMSAYESLEIVPRDIFVAGQEAAMEWTINAATPEGTITFNGVDVFTFDEAARIVSVRAYWERARIRGPARPLLS